MLPPWSVAKVIGVLVIDCLRIGIFSMPGTAIVVPDMALPPISRLVENMAESPPWRTW